jgi:hypothetical protein
MKKFSAFQILLIVIACISLVLNFYFLWSIDNDNQLMKQCAEWNAMSPNINNAPAPATEQNPNSNLPPSNANQPEAQLSYGNEQYRFSFSLPASWQGYTILNDKWQSYPINDTDKTPTETGPLITIRHPQWTAAVPRQDIPIMVFTVAQWSEVIGGRISLGAAPIPPSVLGVNANYVFTLPARYNFAFPAGYEEVDRIIQTHPLQAF